MNNEYIFILASRANGAEHIANNGIHEGRIQIVAFSTLQDAKDDFFMAYKIIPAGPAANVQAFSLEFERLAIHRPAILKLPVSTASQIVKEAKSGTHLMEFGAPQLLPQSHFSYIEVKKGFIDQYLALDILKDLESITSVDAQGRIMMNKFRIHGPEDKDLPIEPFTDEKFDEELKRRGLL